MTDIGAGGDVVSRRSFLRLSGALGLGGAALGLSGVALAACGGNSAPSAAPVKAKKDGDTLALFGWQGYWAPSVMSAFEKEYGIKIQQTYETAGDQSLKVSSGLPWDCCITNSIYLPQFIKGGVLRQIDHAELSNYDQVIPSFHNPFYDSGAKHSVGYAFGPMGLAWQSNRTGNMTGSWTDLWTHAPTIKPHAYGVEGANVAIAMGLMYHGFNENSNNPVQLDAAVSALQKLKPYIGGFASLNSTEMLAAGDAWMIPSYQGNLYTALFTAKNPEYLRFELCKEGQLLNADNMSISASAQHPGNGMLFINWMLEPENMAKNVQYIGYPTPTTAGLAAYTKLVSKYPFLDPGSIAELSNWQNWEASQTAAEAALWNQKWLEVQA